MISTTPRQQKSGLTPAASSRGSKMNVVFRTDSSFTIGSGHVMRCLAFAAALQRQGADCRFICRAQPGNLIDRVRENGFGVTTLASAAKEKHATGNAAATPPYAAWLAADWRSDAEATRTALATAKPDWLLVDHYGIDHRWEQHLRPYCGRIMVIDDLADRAHDCDFLLDQTVGTRAAAYAGLVPADCRVLAGSRYALLRPEFARWRDKSLRRRASPAMEKLLISMGGVDRGNATGRVLAALRRCQLPRHCRIVVVMGGQAPWLGEVKQAAVALPWPCEVRVDVPDMARLMAACDLAVGGAGNTAWERCCLGLPTLMVVLADNQRRGAQALHERGAAAKLELSAQFEAAFPRALARVATRPVLQEMAAHAAEIVDGRGCERVRRQMAGFPSEQMGKND